MAGTLQRQPTKGLFDSTKQPKASPDRRSAAIQLQRTESNRSSKLFRTPSHLSQIPDSSAHLRTGCMQRRFMDTTIVGWSMESLVLTENKLFISKPACAGEEDGQGALGSMRVRSRLRLHASAHVWARVPAHVRVKHQTSQAGERCGKSKMTFVVHAGARAVFDEILLRDVIECELKEDSEDHNQLQVIFRTGMHSQKAALQRRH